MGNIDDEKRRLPEKEYKELCSAAHKATNGTCVVCKTAESEQIHHTSYSPTGIDDQVGVNVFPVCKNCHKNVCHFTKNWITDSTNPTFGNQNTEEFVQLLQDNMARLKTDSKDVITQIKLLADQLLYASDTEIAAVTIEHRLDKPQSDLLLKFIKEYKQLAVANSVLEYSIAVPELLLKLILPDCNLRELLIDFGKKLQVPEAAIVMTLLTTAASRCTVGTSLTLQKSSNHSVPPYLYTVLVGHPGSGKTPLLNSITTAPCRILQSKLDSDYHTKLSQYEADLRYFNSLAKEQKLESETPKPPARQAAYISDATTEAVVLQMEQHPQSAVFLLIDEFASMVLNRGKYSKGKNSDAQFYNSVYSGQIPIVARKITGITGCGKGGIGILGGTQPTVLQQLFSASSPESGEWARYCFTYIPDTTRFVDCENDSDVKVNFSPYLASVYERISSYGAREYSLSKDAYRLWGAKSNEYNQKVANCHQPYLRHVYAKANEILGRFALVLHLTQSALLEIEPLTQVTIETMSKAVVLTEYYIAASAKAFANIDPETQIFNCLVETLKSQGRITCSAFLSRFSGDKRKMVANQFSLWAQLLESRGLATKQKARNGYSLIYQQQPL